jgi:(2Fe-2S) ferredoxin
MKIRKPGQVYNPHFFICQGKTCAERMAVAGTSAEEAKAFFKTKIKEHGLQESARACTASCFNFCDEGPNIVVYPEVSWHAGVTREDWEKIFEKHK